MSYIFKENFDGSMYEQPKKIKLKNPTMQCKSCGWVGKPERILCPKCGGTGNLYKYKNRL